MAVTEQSYTGNGSTTNYSFTFPYLKSTDIQVQVDAAVTTAWSLANATTVQFNSAPANGAAIKILRDTNVDNLTATFYAGSAIKSEDLNDNFTQNLYVTQEIGNRSFENTGTSTMIGNLNMGEDTTIVFEGATDNDYETTLTVTDPTADRTITIPNVTGTVVTTGDTATVTATMLAADSVDSSELVDGSIDASHIASSAVTTAKINADAVTGAKIADDAIDSEHYTDGSIDTAHIADSQITTAKLADTAVTTAKITDANVTTAKIAADAITGAKIADDSIDSEHYVDGSIDTAHIADSQITSAKIADATIVAADLASDAVTTAKITAGNVTTAKIAADAVTGAKLADDAIDSEHYTDGSIDTAHIADANITAAKLASDAVTTAKVTDANITTAKIADNAITFAKIGCEQTTISDTDTSVPTSGAVVDYVAAQIAPIGGLEVIANKDSFPETQPAAGVVISIADAVGIVVNGSGTSTTPDTITSDATVTINNINSSFNSSTVASGIGWLVSSTGSGQIYNYHKANIKESDVIQLSDDINDFNSRYRVNAGEPGSNNDEGDLVYDTSADKMKVYDSATSAWKEVTSTGDFKYLFLCPAGGTGAPTLDGSIATYDLRESSNSGSAASVTSAAQLLVSINGVVQKANTGTSAPAEGFAIVDANTIIFGANLASGDSVFIVQSGSAVSIPTPGDGTVSTAKIAADAVTGAKIADNAIDSEHYVDGSIDHAHLANDAVDGDNIADDAINSEHYTDGSIDTAHIADDQVTLAKMAGLARGKIIYGDASGNPAALAIGTSGYTLISDGTDISWGEAAAGASGGGSDKVFWENGQTVTTNYTITNNMNAGSFGPITINSGVTVTVGSGEYWTIV